MKQKIIVTLLTVLAVLVLGADARYLYLVPTVQDPNTIDIEFRGSLGLVVGDPVVTQTADPNTFSITFTLKVTQ